MESLKLYWVDAFSDKPFYGNAAAVILDADDVSDADKQIIAREMNLSETVFVSRSEVADFRVQFFTPGQETALCGHGTVAAFYMLSLVGEIKSDTHGSPVRVEQETKAGILPIEVFFGNKLLPDKIMMYQTLPDFIECDINKNVIAEILGISTNCFVNDYPLKIVSTGRPKLFVPIISRDILYEIKPNFDEMADYCNRKSITGFHLFTFDTHFSNSITTARHFAPSAGVNEDPVTGIAAGALGCYLSEYGKRADDTSFNFQMEQGFNMGRNGIVHVEINMEDQQYESVKVGGKACMLFNTEIRL